MRMLSADILHRRASSCSVCSMRMGFPAHGKRMIGRLTVSSVIVVLPYHLGTPSFSMHKIDECRCPMVVATCGHRARYIHQLPGVPMYLTRMSGCSLSLRFSIRQECPGQKSRPPLLRLAG